MENALLTQRARNALLLLLAATSLSACRVGHNPRELLVADSAAIADIAHARRAYQDALLGGDPRRIGPFFTADARVSGPDAPDIVGSSGVLAERREFFDGGGAVTAVSLDTEELHVDGGVAFEIGTFQERRTLPNNGEEALQGRYMLRWQRGPEARWQIARFLFNLAPATEPADSSAR
jgi:ketosteroid isomerase-like protein